MANLTFQQLEALVAQAGGTPTQQEYLAGIAAGVESGGNPTAQNPTSTASGLWQELTSTWLGSGGGKYAPTAKQASPLDQAIIAVQQSVGGYQPWAPDLGGYYPGYGAPTAAGTNPQSPAPGSPVANYLKSIGAGVPAAGATTPSASAPQATLAGQFPGGNWDPLNWGGAIAGAGGGAIASGILGVVQTITAPLRKFVEDAGLVVLGIVLFAVALALIVHGASSGGGSSSPAQPEIVEEEEPEEHEERPVPPAPHEAYRAGEERGRAASSSTASSRREGASEVRGMTHEAEHAAEAGAAVAAG